MTPAENELAEATAARTPARAKFEGLQSREQRLANTDGEDVAAIAAARDGFRSAAGLLAAGGTDTTAVEIAKAALREAEARADEAALRREGLAFIVAAARRELDNAEKRVARAASALAQERAAALKAHLLGIAIDFGRSKVELRQLARFAAQMEALAGNSGADPIGGASGERCPPFSDELDEALAGPEPEAITVADLVPAPKKGKAA